MKRFFNTYNKGCIANKIVVSRTAFVLSSISMLIDIKKNIVMCEVITMTSKESLQIRNNSCVCKFFCLVGIYMKNSTGQITGYSVL